MAKNYWSTVTQQRLGRRRLLAASGSMALGGALLAACGGGSSGSSGGSTTDTSQSSLVVKPTDTSKDAKRGGTYHVAITTDANSWDPYFTGVWFGTLGAVVFSRLTIVKPGVGGPSQGEIGGDLASGWEFAPDGLTATFHLRDNAHWHTTPPVNGRLVDAQDVLFSWNRWKTTSGTRSILDHDSSPDAPVLSVTSPDPKTIVFKLGYPVVTLPSLMSATTGQAFHILPRELDGGYDPRHTPIGSGPFILNQQVASAFMNFKRNPGYYDTDHPYVDAVEYPIITEYATGLAAFKSGQLLTYAVHPEDIIQTKSDTPDLALYTANVAIPSAAMFFGYRNNEKAPFRDKRLRQAYSMSIDRDLFAETEYNISKFTSQGYPVTDAWSSIVKATEFSGWWLDPRDKSFGDNAKYFQHNVADAKKLVAAAGFANGVEYVATRAKGNYGPDYDRQIDIMDGMAADAGFKPTTNGVDYTTVLVPNYEHARGDFEGTGWMLRPASSSDPIEKIAEWIFSGSGSNFTGFDPDGKGNFAGDPFIDDLVRKSRSETDNNKRKQMLIDIQKEAAEQQYIIQPVSGATGFTLAWPAVRNYNYYQGDPRGDTRPFYLWLDPTLKPLAS